MATPRTCGFLPAKILIPALPTLLNLKSVFALRPVITKHQLDRTLVFLDGSVTLVKLKSLNISITWQNVPFDNAYLDNPLKYMFEKIPYLDKYFNSTRFPGSLLNQKFCGRFEAKSFWPRCIPNVSGLIENDPVTCLFTDIIFFLFLKNDSTVNILLSHTCGYRCGIELILRLDPLEKTVILPILFLPALFFRKNLK